MADKKLVDVADFKAAFYDLCHRTSTSTVDAARILARHVRKCSVCGATRIQQDDGSLGACSLIGCPDPMRDYNREHAPLGICGEMGLEHEGYHRNRADCSEWEPM